jgi:WhiB family redox-sensing transcriptional regulator
VFAVPGVDQSWHMGAACRGGQRSCCFYPPLHHETRDERAERELQAKAICESCPVRQPCLEFALASREPFGIWGGLTEQERRARLAAV